MNKLFFKVDSNLKTLFNILRTLKSCYNPVWHNPVMANNYLITFFFNQIFLVPAL